MNKRNDEVISLIRDLFINRDDYSTQKADGGYIHGEYINDEFIKVNSVTDEILLRHFSGEKTLLAFCHRGSGEDNAFVKWACFDIDCKIKDDTGNESWNEEEARSIVFTLCETLDKMNYTYIIEFSGGKGYHVWVFLDDNTPAKNAIHFLESTCQRVADDNSSVRLETLITGADKSIRLERNLEHFPKSGQDMVPEGQTGSGVKLPLGKHQKTGTMTSFQEIIDGEDDKTLEPVSFDKGISLLTGVKKHKLPPAPAKEVPMEPLKKFERDQMAKDSLTDIIKDNISITDIDSYKFVGQGGKNTCPVCGPNSSPSLELWDGGKAFKCWDCANHNPHAKGSVIDYIMFRDSVDIATSLESLTEYLPENLKPKRKSIPTVVSSSGNGDDKVAIHITVGDVLLDKYHIVYVGELDAFYFYKEGRYVLDTNIMNLKSEAGILMGEKFTTAKQNNSVGYIAAHSARSIKEFSDETNKYKINLNNCILNVRTGATETHSPEFLSFERLPVDYEPSSDCPNWEKFLLEVMSPSDVEVVQEYVGYTLYKDNSFEKALMLVGVGANGKSTFLRIIEHLLGEDNYSSQSLQQMDRDTQSLFDIQDKLAVVCSDLSPKAFTTDTFKRLVSNDMLSMRPNYARSQLKFRSRTKFIGACNKPPRPRSDDSDAFFRRWLIIKFPNQFLASDPNTDPFLDKKLLAELSGILNWALDGLKRLLSNNSFTHNQSQEEVRMAWEEMMTPSISFANLYLMPAAPEYENNKLVGKAGKISKDDMFEVYHSWSRAKGYPAVSKVAFGKEITAAFPRIKTGKMGPKGEQVNCWVNVTWEKPIDDIWNEIHVGYQSDTKSDTFLSKSGGTSGIRDGIREVSELTLTTSLDSFSDDSNTSKDTKYPSSSAKLLPYAENDSEQVLGDNTKSSIVSEPISDTMIVKITDSIPAFVDANNVERKLSEGEEVELPKINARLLIEEGLAERL